MAIAGWRTDPYYYYYYYLRMYVFTRHVCGYVVVVTSASCHYFIPCRHPISRMRVHTVRSSAFGWLYSIPGRLAHIIFIEGWSIDPEYCLDLNLLWSTEYSRRRVVPVLCTYYYIQSYNTHTYAGSACSREAAEIVHRNRELHGTNRNRIIIIGEIIFCTKDYIWRYIPLKRMIIIIILIYDCQLVIKP